MASHLEKRTVNAAGLVQGVTLVTFPAASTLFTASNAHHLSSSQYGAMFVPQMITAVAASTTGVAGSHIAVLGHRWADLASGPGYLQHICSHSPKGEASSGRLVFKAQWSMFCSTAGQVVSLLRLGA